MRLISQDKKLDLPYEQFYVFMNYKNQKEILAGVPELSNDDDSYFTLAKYGSEEESMKVMNMLRKCRKKFFIFPQKGEI